MRDDLAVSDPTGAASGSPAGPTAAPGAGPTNRSVRRRAVRARVRLRPLLDAVTGPLPALGAAWVAALILIGVQSPMMAMLVSLGLAGAFVAGLIGIGGAVLMIPLLLYVPPLFELSALDMRTAAGVTMVQVAVAGITGMLAHRRSGYVQGDLVLVLGGATMVGALAGGVASSFAPQWLLSGIFASLAAIAAVPMLMGRTVEVADNVRTAVAFNRVTAIVTGVGTGILFGMVGTGGGFLLVPVMIFLLHVPLRTSVGSSLAIVAMSGLAGTVGKALTHQIDWLLALSLVTGALPGAQLGSTVSRRVPAGMLSRLLGLLLAAIAVLMWRDLWAG